MKKNFLVILFITFVCTIIGGVIYMSLLRKTDNVGSFVLEEYRDALNQFESNKIVGRIDSSVDAKKAAETIWIDIYGENIKKRKPYKVSFDKKSNIYLVEGSLQKNWDGGVPYILVQKKDGKVLAVWHDK